MVVVSVSLAKKVHGVHERRRFVYTVYAFQVGGGRYRRRGGFGPIEDRLPLSLPTRRRLQELSAWHDGALNWDYPPDPSPWSSAERKRFEQATSEMLAVIRAELGPQFEVFYEAL
jgi:hypothetical protein